MHITVNTAEPISDLDKSILTALIGIVEVEPMPEPAKKPEPAPEPMAEEPVDEPDEPEEQDDDGVSDEDLLALAVKKATEMVAGGEAAKVREALDAAGANRVRELNADNVRAFFKALS